MCEISPSIIHHLLLAIRFLLFIIPRYFFFMSLKLVLLTLNSMSTGNESFSIGKRLTCPVDSKEINSKPT